MGYSMRLRDFLKDSLIRTGDQIRESTRRETRSAMEDFIGTIGNIDFQDVTLTKGEFYIQACLDRGNSKGTVAKKLRHIKRVFKLAVNRKQLVENPLQHIAMPNQRQKDRQKEGMAGSLVRRIQPSHRHPEAVLKSIQAENRC